MHSESRLSFMACGIPDPVYTLLTLGSGGSCAVVGVWGSPFEVRTQAKHVRVSPSPPCWMPSRRETIWGWR